MTFLFYRRSLRWKYGTVLQVQRIPKASLMLVVNGRTTPPMVRNFHGMFTYIPFLTQGVRNPWTRHLTKKNRQRNHLSFTSGAPKDPVFFKRMDMVISNRFPMWRIWFIVQLKANHFFEWTFQVPGCISAGWLMHLVMFCLTLWGDWLRGYLQCAGAYCHWPWEEGRILRQKLPPWELTYPLSKGTFEDYVLFPQVGYVSFVESSGKKITRHFDFWIEWTEQNQFLAIWLENNSFEQWRCFLGRFFLQERTQLVIQWAGAPRRTHW